MYIYRKITVVKITVIRITLGLRPNYRWLTVNYGENTVITVNYCKSTEIKITVITVILN